MNPRTLHLLGHALVLTVGAAALASCSTVSALEVSTGTCFSLPEGETVTSVTAVDCTEAHDAQVVGTTTLDAQSLPSADDLDTRAQAFCTDAFAQWVGTSYAKSSLDLLWWVPTSDSWNRAGDRGITCVAVTSDRSDVTESFEDSGL